MIDAIHEMFQVWGAQQRGIENATDQGWLERSVIAKFRDSQFEPKADTGATRTARGKDSMTVHPVQFTEEGHTGPGLQIAVAMRREPFAPEELQAIAWLKYVVFVPSWYDGSSDKYKSTRVGLSSTEYWRYIDRLHYWTASRLDAVGTDKSREIPQKIVPGGLKKVTITATNPRHKVQLPELSLTALQRSTLSIKR